MSTHEPAMEVDHATAAIAEVTTVLKAILWVILAVVVMLTAFMLPSARPKLLLAVAYFLPVPVLALLLLTAVLAFKGRGASVPALVVGCLFLLGGLAFDIAATVMHSPDLNREANYLARIFLDSGHGLTFTYVYGIVMSVAFAIATCFWWMAFLVHYRTWLSLVRAERFLEFLRLAYGGGLLSWRQLFFPLNTADLVAAYRATYYWSWINWTIVIIAITFCHIYAGLEWFGLVPWVHPIMMYLIATIPAFLLMCGWLYWEFETNYKLPAAHTEPAGEATT